MPKSEVFSGEFSWITEIIKLSLRISNLHCTSLGNKIVHVVWRVSFPKFTILSLLASTVFPLNVGKLTYIVSILIDIYAIDLYCVNPNT